MDEILHARLRHLEIVEEVLLDLGRLSVVCRDEGLFLAGVHAGLGRLMHATNFFVRLYDASRGLVREAYGVDQFDYSLDPTLWFELATDDQSPTAWVIRHGRALRTYGREPTPGKHRRAGWGVGRAAEHWLGLPLHYYDGSVMGAMVVQSYDVERGYSGEDQVLFELVATHVSNALEKLQSVQRLEQMVADRTASLEREVQERKRAQTVQAALYQIAELATASMFTDELYARLHEVVSQLFDARNFMLLRYYHHEQVLRPEYFVDEVDKLEDPDEIIPIGHGLSSYVIRSNCAQLIDAQRLEQLIADGEVDCLIGTAMVSWMGVPIRGKKYLYGVIVVQSYTPKVIYTPQDLSLLEFISSHVATMMDRLGAAHLLSETKQQLEQQNATLQQALTELEQAQAELVRQEKLASLGELVAGIAHEVNTPLGICVTATSHMVEELKLTREDLAAGQLDEAGLQQFFDTLDESLRIMSSNTQRAAALVRSFKQVAVDQSSDQIREFELQTYLQEVILSLAPKLKGKPYQVQLDCPAGIMLQTHAGALAQVISNLLLNSLLHGFEGRSQGLMRLHANQQDGMLQLSYSDDGVGMDADNLAKLFNPFFTTKRGSGGSGLGAHIVFNLVTGALGGQLHVHSEPGAGLHYELQMPLRLKGNGH